MATPYTNAGNYPPPPSAGTNVVNGYPQQSNPINHQQQQPQIVPKANYSQNLMQNPINPGQQHISQQNNFYRQSQQQQQQMPIQNTNLPQHVLQNVQLTNGTGGTNSSRTASPARNNPENPQIKRTNYPPPSSVQSQQTINANSLSNLTSSLQNLSAGGVAPIKSNGPPQLTTGGPLQPPIHQYPPQQNNFQAPSSQTLLANQNSASSQNQNIYPPPVRNEPQNNYGSQTSIRPGSNPAYPPTSNANLNFNQNALNNNVQQQIINRPPPSASNAATPMYSTSQPLTSLAPSANHPPSAAAVNYPPSAATVNYPPTATAANYPPSSGAVNYPPSAAVKYPPTQQTQQNYQSTFNGQPNTAPLQYQSGPPAQMSVTQHGFNRLWGQDTLDLMQHRHILSPTTLQPPRIVLNNQFHETVNVNPDIMRCTLNKVPDQNSLLQKSRLPLGLLVHPFRDINNLPVIQCPNIVRCRLCRTYINPFVYFVDSKMWKCNLCYRVNELPDDFQFDPATKTYGDVTRRPEVRSSTIEFIAPSEYMLRPPQPSIYLFLFDVSILAQQSGYLEMACKTISKCLEDMPGDARTQVGFIAYNSAIHFYNIAEGYNQPHEMALVDIDDPFLPCPDNLLINLKECKELIKDLLNQLPTRFADSHDPGSCLGAALQVAYKLMVASGGRVTVFQTCLPNKGAGALEAREDPNNRSSKDVAHLNPATDFYKRHALECSGYQIAVDLFVLNQQYVDLGTISGIAKHSGGSIYHFPLYQKTKPHHVDDFKQCLKRYLSRKIGFEAVMRIRCTRGLQVHTFHGNFFVRSTDLLSLPNVNPDAGYGMQISYDESITDVKTVCFQAALLYTNSEGERRIRVHTLCLPVTTNLNEVMHSADSQAIIGLLSKMAVDRSLSSNLSDAREAFINATIDILSAFKIAQNLPSGQTGQLMAPKNLALLPLYILALLKHTAFRVGTSTRLDDRIAAMDAMKTLPLDQLMKYIYPEFYVIDCLFQNIPENEDEENLPDPPCLQLSAEYLDSRSIFLIDSGRLIIIYVGLNVPQKTLEKALNISSTAELPDVCFGLPITHTPENEALQSFINHLNEDKPYLPPIQIIRDTSTSKGTFIEKLADDRSESSLSYYEFLQHLRTQVK